MEQTETSPWFFFVFVCKVFVTNLSLIILDFSLRLEFWLKTDFSFDNHQIINRIFIENWQWVFDCKNPLPLGEWMCWVVSNGWRVILWVWRGVPLPPGFVLGSPQQRNPHWGELLTIKLGGVPRTGGYRHEKFAWQNLMVSKNWTRKDVLWRVLSTMLAVYELQAQQGRDRHLAFDSKITDWHL